MFILSRMLRYYCDHYSYWFFLLYCSVISRSFLNLSTLSNFIFPAFISFRLCLSQVYSRLYGHRHHSPANQCCVQFVQHRESGCSSRKEKFFSLKWEFIKPLYTEKQKTTHPRRISRLYLAIPRFIFVPLHPLEPAKHSTRTAGGFLFQSLTKNAYLRKKSK